MRADRSGRSGGSGARARTVRGGCEGARLLSGARQGVDGTHGTATPRRRAGRSGGASATAGAVDPAVVEVPADGEHGECGEADRDGHGAAPPPKSCRARGGTAAGTGTRLPRPVPGRQPTAPPHPQTETETVHHPDATALTCMDVRSRQRQCNDRTTAPRRPRDSPTTAASRARHDGAAAAPRTRRAAAAPRARPGGRYSRTPRRAAACSTSRISSSLPSSRRRASHSSTGTPAGRSSAARTSSGRRPRCPRSS